MFLVRPDGSVLRSLLIPPVTPNVILRQGLEADVPSGSRLIMDQPQGATEYFSKFPSIGYEDRTDLTMELLAANAGPVSLRRAQKAVDLEDVNPEASEDETDLYLIDVIGSPPIRLTPEDGLDCSQPEYISQDLLVFQNGFESGDVSAWATSQP